MRKNSQKPSKIGQKIAYRMSYIVYRRSHLKKQTQFSPLWWVRVHEWFHLKKRTQCRPSAGNPKHEILNPKLVLNEDEWFPNKTDFAKQSQFGGCHNECKILCYKKLCQYYRLWRAKKQSQSKPKASFQPEARSPKPQTYPEQCWMDPK